MEDKPVVINGKNIHFKGRYILDAVLDYLNVNLALDSASQVVVAGGSAGGLATFMNIDYIKSKLGKDVKLVGIPDAGFFLK
mmetsp:Transcript_4967/g.4381  ORF Transcript_4967/g.4381 Transcript_4967/m.4381 type:complete len:81 (+) Transcript_4967:404-646(+)